MSWAKIDDQLHAHPKVASMDYRMLPALGLHMLALSWCAGQLTDGFLPAAQPLRLAGDVSKLLPRRGLSVLIDCLLDAGLWETVEGGYQIHDYLEYNPSREEVLAERAKVKDRVTNWRRNRVRNAERNAECNAVTQGVTNDSSNPVSNASPVPGVPTVHSARVRARESSQRGSHGPDESFFADDAEREMFLEYKAAQQERDRKAGITDGR